MSLKTAPYPHCFAEASRGATLSPADPAASPVDAALAFAVTYV